MLVLQKFTYTAQVQMKLNLLDYFQKKSYLTLEINGKKLRSCHRIKVNIFRFVDLTCNMELRFIVCIFFVDGMASINKRRLNQHIDQPICNFIQLHFF